MVRASDGGSAVWVVALGYGTRRSYFPGSLARVIFIAWAVAVFSLQSIHPSVHVVSK